MPHETFDVFERIPDENADLVRHPVFRETPSELGEEFANIPSLGTVPHPQQFGGLYTAPNRRRLHQQKLEELLTVRFVYTGACHFAC